MSTSDFALTRYLFEHFDRVWPRVVEHITLSSISLAIALVISLPLGLLLSRTRSLATPVLIILGIIYTIPSFALFAFLVPFTGIGTRPAIIALVAYSLVVLVRSTMVAFNSVDSAVKEAARGMGMSRSQVLWRIEVPLALPILLAGVRIASLSTIGLASIAAWISAGGLGQLLNEGLRDPTYSKLYAGLICIGGIAVVADLIFRIFERLARVPGIGRATARKVAVVIQPKEA
jgi:osmoprotectant transport system permease protein